MSKLKIGLLHKKRGNFAIQEKFTGVNSVADTTDLEVSHHKQALVEAGYDVYPISWGVNFIKELKNLQVDLVFNVSSLVEAAILEELEIPYVGSNTSTIAITLNKTLAKKLWLQAGLPTSPFYVASTKKGCERFKDNPPFEYPLFIKPVAGRGSAGVNETSIIKNYDQLVDGVENRLKTIEQPVLIERFLQGREITLGIIGNQTARVLPPLEIVYGEGAVTLTFEKKELDDDQFYCPASLTVDENNGMQRLALQAYQVLGFRDYGRIDTILTKEGPYLLEGNVFAGLMCTPPEKPHSYMGFMARAEGKNSKDLLDEIIRTAIERINLWVRK